MLFVAIPTLRFGNIVLTFIIHQHHGRHMRLCIVPQNRLSVVTFGSQERIRGHFQKILLILPAWLLQGATLGSSCVSAIGEFHRGWGGPPAGRWGNSGTGG